MEDALDGVAARACPNVDRDTAKCGLCMGTSVAVISIILFALSFDTVTPTSFGLLQNKFSGYVDTDNVYNPGRYFVYLGHGFIQFPKTRVTVQFSDWTRVAGTDQSAPITAPPIKARTGPDPTDVSGESGGQPLDLSISFQYRFDFSQIPYVYQMFGLVWEASFIRFARQAISNAAQEFTPAEFWEQRSKIEMRMQQVVSEALLHQGHAIVDDLQLMRVDFSSKYEDIILRVQLQEQLKTTKRYNMTVTEVLKSVDIKQSETQATIMRINAEAAAESRVVVNRAQMDALILEQTTKAIAYRRLKEHLGWSTSQFLEYVKLRSLNAQPSENIIVGTSPLGGAAVSE